MAELKGRSNRYVETSEIKVNSELLLTEEELENVAGGQEVQEGWTIVQPADICDSFEMRDDSAKTAYRNGMPHVCATCKHCNPVFGTFYCVLANQSVPIDKFYLT